MASVNIHYTNNLPIIEVRALANCGDTLVLNLDVLGGDKISLFFENEDALYDFVNSVQTAFNAHLQDTEEK